MQRVCARCIDRILILMQCVCAMYGEDFTGTKSTVGLLYNHNFGCVIELSSMLVRFLFE
jgi:hypothetical protein